MKSNKIENNKRLDKDQAVKLLKKELKDSSILKDIIPLLKGRFKESYSKDNRKPNEITLPKKGNLNKIKINNVDKADSRKLFVPEDENPLPNLEKGNFNETICFVLQSIFSDEVFDKEYYTKALKQVHDTYCHLIKNHGVTQGTKKWKERQLYLTLVSEGRKPDPLPWVATVGPHDIIESLSSLERIVVYILQRQPNWEKAYQAFITVMALPRISKELPDLDIQSITDPFKGKVSEYRSFLNSFKEFVKNSKRLNFKEEYPDNLEITPRMRMTQGPNGLPTLSTSIEEAGTLLKDERLSKSVELFCTLTGNEDFFTYLTKVASISKDAPTKGLIGRIAQVPDSLNKNRVVAMVDYWTNTMLAPLEELARWLLKYKFKDNDYLRNHSEGADRVRLSKRKSWSLDLSSWTDRFPIDLQQFVVEKMLGKNLGQHWRILLTSRGYWVADLSTEVYYKVGQPMGSKSSFAIASLAHHMLLHYNHFNLPKEVKEECPINEAYCIVGDDLVIFNELLMEKVKESYLILGVDVSLPKSKIPVGTDIFTEFCSRTSINNIDVSRVPPNVIRQASLNWRSFPVLLKEMVRRGIQPKMSTLPSYLNKVVKGKEGTDYLSLLKVVLTLPVLGTDLSSLASQIDRTVYLPDTQMMREAVYNRHILLALEKVDKANDVFSVNFQFGEPEWDELTSMSRKTDKSDPEYIGLSKCVWNSNGPIYKLALLPKFEVKQGPYNQTLKEKGIPHPAAIAAVYYSYRCSVGIFRGLPGLQLDPNLGKELTVMSWLKEIGKQVSAVLPKEAQDLAPTVGNQGLEYIRTQILHYLDVYKHMTKYKDKPMEPYELSNGVKLDLTKDIRSDGITDLVEEWGNIPTHTRMAFTYLVDADPLFTKVVTTTKAAAQSRQ